MEKLIIEGEEVETANIDIATMHCAIVTVSEEVFKYLQQNNLIDNESGGFSFGVHCGEIILRIEKGKYSVINKRLDHIPGDPVMLFLYRA